MSKVQMKPTCLLSVPLETYANDFSFIVNGDEFKTSRIISDLISPVICQIHSLDPTINTFIIDTRQPGDFSQILKLLEFKQIQITEDQLDFFAEVLEKLGNESIDFEGSNARNEEEITIDNVFEKIKKHEPFKKFYFRNFEREVEFISSHFYEICESKKEEVIKIQLGTLYDVLKNEKLQLQSEDQLFEFINGLYSNDHEYSILYETVRFENASSEKIKEFLGLFDYNEIDGAIWGQISKRLEEELNVDKEKSDRYIVQGIEFVPNSNSPFSGIINHLRTQSNGNIENEINITASSIGTSSQSNQPKTVILYENSNNYYYSNNKPNDWLCFDFKEHRVILTDYTIRSGNHNPNDIHLKNWKIEGSTDNEKWDTLDEKANCSDLNGRNIVHTFHIDNKKTKSKRYRFIRIQETGNNWRNDNYLSFNVIELFGSLI